MKTSKPAPKTTVQEECGVWLDTVELKGKAKQKRQTRPISKLLNPFGGGGYNLAVALNFTQTKVEMPKTKQSSISTFFTAQRRVLNKMSTSEDPSSTPALTVTAGKKRKCETHHNPEPDMDHDWKCETVTEPEAKVFPEQEASRTPSPRMHWDFKEPAEEINPPQSKKRLISTTSLPEDSQHPPQAWSQDPLLTLSQYGEDGLDHTYQENKVERPFSDSEPSFLDSLQSEEAFKAQMEGRTSTQHIFEQFDFSQKDVEKENCRLRSPSKHSAHSHIQPRSNHERTELKSASPAKNNPSCVLKKLNKQESPNSQFRWIKPRGSPLKNQAVQQSCRVVNEDSLAMLFTQDSEGFKVIAHRRLHARSPLKDQSNINFGATRSRAVKSMEEEEEEEEDEMLFTQDSQGNMVIKH